MKTCEQSHCDNYRRANMQNHVPVGVIKNSYCKLKFRNRVGRYYIKTFDTSQQAKEYRSQLLKHSHSLESGVIHIRGE